MKIRIFLCNFTSPKCIPLWQHFSRQNRAIINLSAATGFHGPPDLQPMMKINQISPFRDENCFEKFPPQIRRHPILRTFLYGCFATKKKAHSELQRNSDHVRVVNLFSFGQFSPFLAVTPHKSNVELIFTISGRCHRRTLTSSSSAINELSNNANPFGFPHLFSSICFHFQFSAEKFFPLTPGNPFSPPP